MDEAGEDCDEGNYFTDLFVKLSEPGIHFQAGLSDCKAIIGEAAVLECKVSSEDCAGSWYKDGAEVRNLII